MSYNYVYYKDEEMACNSASDVLEHGLTCNKMKSTQGEINMVSERYHFPFCPFRKRSESYAIALTIRLHCSCIALIKEVAVPLQC